MNIAFVVKLFPSISETFVLNQITGLIDRGHEVKIFALTNPKQGKIHADVYKYSLLERTHYLLPQAVSFKTLKFARSLAKYFLVAAKKLPGFLNPRNLGVSLPNILLSPKLHSIADRESYDIICCHFGPNGNIGAMLKDLWKNARLVTFFHAYDLTTYLNEHGKNCYREQFEKIDLALPSARHWVPKLRDLECKESKIKVFHMGTDLQKFGYLAREPSDKIRLLTIGRFTEKKGIEYSIRGVAEAIKQNPKYNIEYTIIGEGKLGKKLKNLINDLNMQQHIFLVGSKKQQEVKEYLYASDIFILASVTAENGDMEGIPVSLMDAMATGLPVVSTFHSGIPELVDNNTNGLLVPPTDSDSLANAITRLVRDPKKRIGLGKAARRKVERDFNCQKQIVRLEDIFERLISNKL